MENTSIPLVSVSWLAAGPSGPEHTVKIQNNGCSPLRIGGLSRAATPRVLQVAQWGVHPENRRTELSRNPKSFASGSYAMTNSTCNCGRDSTRPPGPATDRYGGCSHESFRQAPRRTRDAHLNRRARAGRAERSSRRRRSERRRVLPLAASNGGARPREPVAVRRRGRSVCCGGPGRQWDAACGVDRDAIASPGSLQRQPAAGTGMKRKRGWEAPRKDGRCQRSPERASFWTGRRPQHVGGV